MEKLGGVGRGEGRSGEERGVGPLQSLPTGRGNMCDFTSHLYPRCLKKADMVKIVQDRQYFPNPQAFHRLGSGKAHCP